MGKEPAASGFAVCCLQFETSDKYIQTKKQTGELRLMHKSTIRSA
jgi:hypothetical protein